MSQCCHRSLALDRHVLELVILVAAFWNKLLFKTTTIIQKSLPQDWVLFIVWGLRCTGECASKRSIFFQSWLGNVAEACTHASAGVLLWDCFTGILSVGLQRGVAHVVANEYGADLVRTQLEPGVELADLTVIC